MIILRFTGLVMVLSLLMFFSAKLEGQRVERGEWQDVLKVVSSDVQKNFFDPRMSGLDWAALTEQTRQRIATSDNTGQMTLAISSLLSRLEDSHTYFVPPPLTARADFGFRARAFATSILVYDIAKKGPAEKAGLKLGDAITALNGLAVDRGSFEDIYRILTTVVPATSVDVTAVSAEGGTRAIHIPAHLITTQQHRYIDSVWRVEDDQRAMDVHIEFAHRDYENGITYTRIPTFRGNSDQTYSAISRGKNARVLIIDLRGNRGGLESTLLDFLGFFVEAQDVLAKKISRTGSTDVLIKPRHPGFQRSVIVLVDSDTASAGELAARYLQLKRRAAIIGDTTSGKVNEGHPILERIGAQFTMPFGVMVTSAKLVMPDGQQLEGHGVAPDELCIPKPQDLANGIDPCLDQAVSRAKALLTQAQQ